MAAGLLWLSSCALPSGELNLTLDGGAEEGTLAGRLETNRAVLSDRLKDYADAFAIEVITAADVMVSEAERPEVKAQARLWALRMVPQVNTLAHSQNPKVALIDLVVLVTDQVMQINGESGEKTFQEQRQVALTAAEWCQDRIWMVVEESMSHEDVNFLREQIQSWCEGNRGQGFLGFKRMDLLAEARNPGGAYQKDKGGSFFSNLNRTTSGAAFELNQLNRQVELLTHYAQHSPTYARWSAEAMVFDFMGKNYENSRLAEDIDRINASLESLAGVSREIPEAQLRAIRSIRDETLREIEMVTDRLMMRTVWFAILLVMVIFTFQIGMAVFRCRMERLSARQCREEREKRRSDHE